LTGIKIIEFRSMAKGALIGFVKVELPSGMVLAGVAIMAAERGPWASPPAKPMIGRDGAAMRDAKGKARYAPIVEFRTKELRDRFSSGVIEALRASHPGVLP